MAGRRPEVARFDSLLLSVLAKLAPTATPEHTQKPCGRQRVVRASSNRCWSPTLVLMRADWSQTWLLHDEASCSTCTGGCPTCLVTSGTFRTITGLCRWLHDPVELVGPTGLPVERERSTVCRSPRQDRALRCHHLTTSCRSARTSRHSAIVNRSSSTPCRVRRPDRKSVV